MTDLDTEHARQGTEGLDSYLEDLVSNVPAELRGEALTNFASRA